MRDPVTADDVDLAVSAALGVFNQVLDGDWHVPAGTLDWTCWETVEHMSDDLFAFAMQLAPKTPPRQGYVPIGWRQPRDGGPITSIFADPGAGNAGLLQVFEACGGLLAAVVRTSAPQVLAYHGYGTSDPEGFAAMGLVEVLAHTDDVAAGLGLAWAPPPDLCDRVLRRLFPQAPTGTDRWPTLRWATGRGELPGRARLDSWRWDSTPR